MLALLGCGAVQDELGDTSQEIIGGVVDNGNAAVVAFAENGSAFCTGTLIGRLTVLTAAHCVDGVRAGTNRSSPSCWAPTPRSPRAPSR